MNWVNSQKNIIVLIKHLMIIDNNWTQASQIGLIHQTITVQLI
jgi:hypothetical protein